MAKDWRTDRTLRRLEALLAIADKDNSLLISGNGDVIEPEHGLIAIGSGGPYAQAAAMALLQNTELDAESIARQALGIAADICIYTNSNLTIETSIRHLTMSQMTPREIAQELDKHIIGQSDAKARRCHRPAQPLAADAGK